jgi:HK97 family phage portal protein
MVFRRLTGLFRAKEQPSGAGILHSSPSNSVEIRTADQLEKALRDGDMTGSGKPVTMNRAMTSPAVYSCVRLLAGGVANMPTSFHKRVDDRTRAPASNHYAARLFMQRPNSWQKPAQFKRMMTTFVCLRGNAYALKIRDGRNGISELWPINPDRMQPEQNDDMTVQYRYTRKDGRQIILPQTEVFHLYLLTINGFSGVTPITFARETIDGSLEMQTYGNTVFQNGGRMSGQLKHPKKLGKEGLEFLQASMDAYRAGGMKEGKDLILEEGMTYERMSMTAQDAEWINARKFTNSDIYRIFGVPPHMVGDTEKSTSWGSGIEEQTNGFIAFSLEDYLTMWQESISADLINDPLIYAQFVRQSLVRGNLKARVESGLKEVQMGAITVNEYRVREDMNPIVGGDDRYPPPNQNALAQTKEAPTDEPAQ